MLATTASVPSLWLSMVSSSQDSLGNGERSTGKRARADQDEPGKTGIMLETGNYLGAHTGKTLEQQRLILKNSKQEHSHIEKYW